MSGRASGSGEFGWLGRWRLESLRLVQTDADGTIYYFGLSERAGRQVLAPLTRGS